MSDTVRAYDLEADTFADRYETLSAAEVHQAVLHLIPAGGTDRLALDIGAGSGRDAAWLSSLGFTVTAVEPAAGMRSQGQRRHPDAGIHWIDDRLPDLTATHHKGIAFDLIVLSAVWMHVPPPSRDRAFRKVATLLKPGGTLIISLREGPSEPDRPMWPAPAGEIEALARNHGLSVLHTAAAPDQLGRSEVRWTEVCLRLPDTGAEALPLLRGIILNDDKSSTYKLGLLRAVARVADASPGLAVPGGANDVMDIPLGAVALAWLRMYLPLITAGLPQMPGNSGPDRLGFAREALRQLIAEGVSAAELRAGATFRGVRADALRRALADAGRTISQMPARHTRYPGSGRPVFEVSRSQAARTREELTLDGPTLAAFGTVRVPGPVWRSLQRLCAWVEPVLVSEWARMVRMYGEQMSRPIAPGEVEAALAWQEPTRDTDLARAVARKVLDRGGRVLCVWSNVPLTAGSLDIDHCLPWSVWPCGDLWNLLPASSRVNQQQKGARLPSAAALAQARERVLGWWEEAWLSDPALTVRFEREALAALSLTSPPTPADVFTALQWRRLRLRQDTQVQEWAGA